MYYTYLVFFLISVEGLFFCVCYQKGAEPLQFECSYFVYCDSVSPSLSTEPVQINEVQLQIFRQGNYPHQQPPINDSVSRLFLQLAPLRTLQLLSNFSGEREIQTSPRGTRPLLCRICRGGTRTDPGRESPGVSAASAAPCAGLQSLLSLPAVEKWIPVAESTSLSQVKKCVDSIAKMNHLWLYACYFLNRIKCIHTQPVNGND